MNLSVHSVLHIQLNSLTTMNSIKIDIVSDVVCPWCIVGYKQLEIALENNSASADIHWHPFELNPTMPPEGQNLQEHIAEKYGSTKAQSNENRERLTALGNELGFKFDFSDDSRMANTFKAHQLLHWAGLQSQQHEHQLKLALFKAYFTDQQHLSDNAVLLAVLSSAGFDEKEVQKILEEQTYAADVRSRQQEWTNRGITGVPAMIFNEKYLVSGAQGVDNYTTVIRQVQEEV